MPALDRIAWEILNATADDGENLEQLYRQICLQFVAGDAQACFRATPAAPLLHEVADRVRQLVEGGLLTIVSDENGCPWDHPNDLSYVWRAWFRMTPHGRSIWESSDPISAGQEQPQ